MVRGGEGEGDELGPAVGGVEAKSEHGGSKVGLVGWGGER